MPRQLANLPEFRIGLLGGYRTCGRSRCHRATDGSPSHGPSWALTWKVARKTVTKIIALEDLETVQAQLDASRRFQEITHELQQTRTRICDAPFASGSDEQDGPETGRKKGIQATVRQEIGMLIERMTQGDAAAARSAPESSPLQRARSPSRRSVGERGDKLSTEGGNVGDHPPPHEIALAKRGLVDPRGARVRQVVPDAERTG